MKKRGNKLNWFYEYDCNIYPRVLWVVFNDCSKEVIKDIFEDMPSRDFVEEEAMNGFVMHNCKMKSEVLGGMLMMFRRSTFNAEIVAH